MTRVIGVFLFLYLNSLKSCGAFWRPIGLLHRVMLKVSACYSRYWNIGSSGMDAFTFDWSGKNGWFVPPVYLIRRVVRYMEWCKAFGALIVPLWETGRYWPLLWPEGAGFIDAVKDARYLPETENVCVLGRGSNIVFCEKKLTFKMLALYMDFRQD